MLSRLLGCLFIIVCQPMSCLAYPSQEAVNAAARALYEQQHWDQDVSRFLQHYENMLSKRDKKIAIILGTVTKMVIDQRIEFIYRFP